MRKQFCAGAIALTLLGSIGVAGGQGLTMQTQAVLSPPQAEALSRRLASNPSDEAPAGYQAQVGGTMPQGMQHHAIPTDAAALVPDRYRYSKMPDHILLVDPSNMTVVEIIPVRPATTTGRGSDASSSGTMSEPGSSTPPNPGPAPGTPSSR
jgi:hypothetical protein